MSGENKKLGFILFTGPDSQDAQTVVGLASAALKRGIGVELFLMHNAVHNASVESFNELADKGANITVCTHNADQLKAQRNEKFKYGSQYDHSNMIGEVDRYLAFA